eukprot:353220-Chlamydomonas_euryale.AAC.2
MLIVCLVGPACAGLPTAFSHSHTSHLCLAVLALLAALAQVGLPHGLARTLGRLFLLGQQLLAKSLEACRVGTGTGCVVWGCGGGGLLFFDRPQSMRRLCVTEWMDAWMFVVLNTPEAMDGGGGLRAGLLAAAQPVRAVMGSAPIDMLTTKRATRLPGCGWDAPYSPGTSNLPLQSTHQAGTLLRATRPT